MTGDDNHSWARRTFLKTTGAAGAAAAVTTTVSADTGQEKVRLNLGMSNAASMSTAEAEVQQDTPGNAEVYKREETLGFISVDVPKQAAENIREAFEKKDEFRYAEYDKQLHAFETPNDELYDEQYAPQQMRAPEAYDTTDGSEDVTVAIVDQGVMYDHPDLESRFGSLKGKDFVDGDDDPYPESMSEEYHGTHVAGSASATTDNSTGIAGTSDSTLLSARALSADGGGSLADIAEAVRWSADQGADIINMSLGGGGYTDTMKNAVSYAVSNGALPICAAGNNGESSVSYPAGYSECMAVSAVDSNEDLASFSQYGDKLDVAAPGVDVLSTWTENKSQYGGKYNKISGTSMACPNASGVAALGLAAAGGSGALTPNELRSRLKETAADIGLSEQKQGAGRVDAANIVEAGDGGGGGGNEDPVASFTVNPSSPEAGESATFDASGSSDDGSISSYDWDFGDGATATGQSVSHTYDASGDYSVSLTVTDDEGATGSTTETVSVQSAGDDNEAPVASFSVSPTSPVEGETVSVDASASSDGDGSISSYEWDFGDGSTASGETASNAYAEAGDYTISLTVTDDDGASDTATQSLTVESESGGGSCGDTSSSASAEGSLAGWYDDSSFTYAASLDDPCQATFTLEGASGTDFDLYVTFDGRTPSTYDYDARSITYGSDEQIVVEDLDAGQEFGILIDSYSGSGSFTISVDELGK